MLLKKLLYKWILPKFILKACKSTIPRSGKEGEKVNCYAVALYRNSAPYFVATGYDCGKLLGLKHNGESYKEKYTLELADLNIGELRITHYYGLDTVWYDSIYDAAWHYLTKLVYLKIIIYRFASSVDQYFFSKKMLVTKKRMELLQFMLSDQLNRNHDGIEVIDLMTKLYSIKWVLHPTGDEQQKKLELYLNSLEHTGELKKVNNEYVVTGFAMVTIEKYEKEEERHSGIVNLQKILALLTLGLFLVGLVQTGVIKIPTLIDLSTDQKIESPLSNQQVGGIII